MFKINTFIKKVLLYTYYFFIGIAITTHYDNQNTLSAKVLKAYQNQDLTLEEIKPHLTGLEEIKTVDFKITELVRLLFLSKGKFDTEILEALEEIPFWLPDSKGNERQYWSENHMIMWMSANWLLYESYDFEKRDNLRQVLLHYLNLKNNHGFYEFLSPIYARYTFSGLLNLAEFSKDPEIKEKARKAAFKLFKQILLLVNLM